MTLLSFYKTTQYDLEDWWTVEAFKLKTDTLKQSEYISEAGLEERMNNWGPFQNHFPSWK